MTAPPIRRHHAANHWRQTMEEKTHMTPAQLRAACAMLQITAKDLAEAVDMHPGTLREMLAGKRHGKPKTLEKIKAALERDGIIFFDENGVKMLVRPTGFEPATKPL